MNVKSKKKYFVVFMMLLLSAFMLVGCKNASEKAQQYMEAGDYENAERMYQKLLEEDSSNVDTYLALAQVYGELDRLEDKVAILEQGMETIDSEEIREQYIAACIEETVETSGDVEILLDKIKEYDAELKITIPKLEAMIVQAKPEENLAGLFQIWYTICSQTEEVETVSDELKNAALTLFDTTPAEAEDFNCARDVILYVQDNAVTSDLEVYYRATFVSYDVAMNQKLQNGLDGVADEASRKKIEELVSEYNGVFGTITYPVESILEMGPDKSIPPMYTVYGNSTDGSYHVIYKSWEWESTSNLNPVVVSDAYYTYDENNRLVQISGYNEDDKCAYERVIEYNELGFVTKDFLNGSVLYEQRYDGQGRIIFIDDGWERYTLSYSGDGTKCYVRIYDYAIAEESTETYDVDAMWAFSPDQTDMGMQMQLNIYDTSSFISEYEKGEQVETPNEEFCVLLESAGYLYFTEENLIHFNEYGVLDTAIHESGEPGSYAYERSQNGGGTKIYEDGNYFGVLGWSTDNFGPYIIERDYLYQVWYY